MKKLFTSLALIPLVAIAYTSLDLSSAQFLSQKGIITTQSTDAGYRLDDKITRAEVIGIALKIRGTTLPDGYICRKYFTDTTLNDWVCRAIELASDSALISRNNTLARPQDAITRSEAFAILYKASGLTPTNANIYTSGDPDAAQWQKDLFTNIRNASIEIIGTEQAGNAYKYYPNRLATRAEVFAFGSKILAPNNPSATPADTKTHSISVVDGDTIKYDGETIRMIGLDTPESNTSRYGYIECFGPEATAYLKALLKDAKELTIEKDPSQGEKDKYDRTLAYVFLGTTNINGKMIADGYAFEYTYDKAYKYQKDYKAAETQAKNSSLGLWSSSTCSGDRKKGTNDNNNAPTGTNNTTTAPTHTGTGSSYTCGEKTYCSEMTTCSEAKYYLNTCGLGRLDADKDGIPCESICE